MDLGGRAIAAPASIPGGHSPRRGGGEPLGARPWIGPSARSTPFRARQRCPDGGPEERVGHLADLCDPRHQPHEAARGPVAQMPGCSRAHPHSGRPESCSHERSAPWTPIPPCADAPPWPSPRGPVPGPADAPAPRRPPPRRTGRRRTAAHRRWRADGRDPGSDASRPAAPRRGSLGGATTGFWFR
jgi:hypothetical protein